MKSLLVPVVQKAMRESVKDDGVNKTGVTHFLNSQAMNGTANPTPMNALDLTMNDFLRSYLNGKFWFRDTTAVSNHAYQRNE